MGDTAAYNIYWENLIFKFFRPMNFNCLRYTAERIPLKQAKAFDVVWRVENIIEVQSINELYKNIASI